METKKKRERHSTAFKAKVAIDAIKEDEAHEKEVKDLRANSSDLCTSSGT